MHALDTACALPMLCKHCFGFCKSLQLLGDPPAYILCRFSNYNLDQIMASGNNSTTTEAAFHSAVKEAFLVGVAAKTGLRVTTADNKLQLNRVNILNIKAGVQHPVCYLISCAVHTCIRHMSARPCENSTLHTVKPIYQQTL